MSERILYHLNSDVSQSQLSIGSSGESLHILSLSDVLSPR